MAQTYAYGWGQYTDARSRRATIERLDKLATLLDTALIIPGTNVRFGLDGLIGLIPGIGDAITTALSAYLVFSGARLYELCALESTDIAKHADGLWVTISAGKTDAAKRSFPVHPAVEHIIRRRLKDGDKYLFAGLIPGGPDGKRSWYVSKAFGRYSTRVGIDDPLKDFHSFRRTFVEVGEACEVPETTTKLIVGHKRASMTYGHYSKGARVRLREAIERITYAPEIMRLVRR